MGHSRARARNRIAPRAAVRPARVAAALALLLSRAVRLRRDPQRIVVIVAAGQFTAGQREPGRGGRRGRPPGGQRRLPAAARRRGGHSAVRVQLPTKSLRGCFSESSMATYFDFVLPIVDEFFETTWPSLPLPAHVYFIADGAQMQEACLDQTGSHLADDMSYAYCPADDNVYIGQHIAYELYSLAGDVAPATGIAHEFGHRRTAAHRRAGPQTDEQTLVHENPADCVSGAWLGYANSQRLLEQEDVPAIERYLELDRRSETTRTRPRRLRRDAAMRSSRRREGHLRLQRLLPGHADHRPVTARRRLRRYRRLMTGRISVLG